MIDGLGYTEYYVFYVFLSLEGDDFTLIKINLYLT